jgi:cytochrome c-type biogenesis protein CcmE
MKTGAIIAGLVAVVGLSAMVFAFLTNASPYVTIAEAKAMPGDNLHVAGDLDKSTISTNAVQHEVRFTLKDEKGDRVPVVYHGAPPANMGEATKVVAVGGMKGPEFHASKLLIKCPSKYESTKNNPS